MPCRRHNSLTVKTPVSYSRNNAIRSSIGQVSLKGIARLLESSDDFDLSGINPV